MAETDLKPRVLIVDDERNIADTLATIFRLKGLDAVAAYSAESALDVIEDFEPDIVLSDVIMGKMTGVDLAIYLSRARPDVKVFLFSGHAATGSLLTEAGRKGHDFHLLAKPMSPEKLIEELTARR